MRLLLLGLFTRVSAAIICVELAAAYVIAAAPRGVWPIHNGGNETLLYLVVSLFFAVYGGGATEAKKLGCSASPISGSLPPVRGPGPSIDGSSGNTISRACWTDGSLWAEERIAHPVNEHQFGATGGKRRKLNIKVTSAELGVAVPMFQA